MLVRSNPLHLDLIVKLVAIVFERLAKVGARRAYLNLSLFILTC